MEELEFEKIELTVGQALQFAKKLSLLKGDGAKIVTIKNFIKPLVDLAFHQGQVKENKKEIEYLEKHLAHEDRDYEYCLRDRLRALQDKLKELEK